MNLQLFQEQKYQRILELIFLDYHNQPSLFKKMNPKGYKGYRESYKEKKSEEKDGAIIKPRKIKYRTKSPNNNLIANFFKELGIIKGSKYFFIKEFKNNNKYRPLIKKYKLNPKFFIDYAKSNLKGKDFTKYEKEWIWKFLDTDYYRKIILENYSKQKNIIKKIEYFLLDLCVISEMDFYYRFFKETLDDFERLLKNWSEKEIKDYFNSNVGEWRKFGSDEKEVVMRKKVGEKILLLLGLNKILSKKEVDLF